MSKNLPDNIPARGLSIQEAADYTGVCKSIMKRLVAAGAIKSIRLPGIQRVIVDRVALDEVLTSLREVRS